MKPDIHADDYALTVNTSKDMLECMLAGRLDSISIVPNTVCFEMCMEMLYEAIPSMPFLPKMSVHLDFVEGRCLADAQMVPDLIKTGSNLIGLSWGTLFKFSYMPWKRKKVRRELALEICAQIERTQEAIGKCIEIAALHQIPFGQKGIRIDSHQHSHMIPIVWDALVSVIETQKYNVEYIRNSKEVLMAFLSEVSLWGTYRPVNFVKNRILSLYAHKVDRYYRQHSMDPMYLWGLVMSGRMDRERIERLFEKVYGKAQKDGRTLEILFHPGSMLPEEVTEEVAREAAEEFYMSEGRQIEQDAVMTLEFPN